MLKEWQVLSLKKLLVKVAPSQRDLCAYFIDEVYTKFFHIWEARGLNRPASNDAYIVWMLDAKRIKKKLASKVPSADSQVLIVDPADSIPQTYFYEDTLNISLGVTYQMFKKFNGCADGSQSIENFTQTLLGLLMIYTMSVNDDILINADFLSLLVTPQKTIRYTMQLALNLTSKTPQDLLNYQPHQYSIEVWKSFYQGALFAFMNKLKEECSTMALMRQSRRTRKAKSNGNSVLVPKRIYTFQDILNEIQTSRFAQSTKNIIAAELTVLAASTLALSELQKKCLQDIQYNIKLNHAELISFFTEHPELSQSLISQLDFATAFLDKTAFLKDCQPSLVNFLNNIDTEKKLQIDKHMPAVELFIERNIPRADLGLFPRGVKRQCAIPDDVASKRCHSV